MLIRHALSEFNYKSLLIQEKHGLDSPEYQEFMLDSKMIDPSLHQLGQNQCSSNRGAVNGIDFETVYVSPMRRTL